MKENGLSVRWRREEGEEEEREREREITPVTSDQWRMKDDFLSFSLALILSRNRFNRERLTFNKVRR